VLGRTEALELGLSEGATEGINEVQNVIDAIALGPLILMLI
jgi:hypothetical protein